MKDECDLSGCSTPEEVKEMIDNYVYYYNNERPQWTRNKMTPAEYEDYLNSLSIMNIQIIFKTNRKSMIK